MTPEPPADPPSPDQAVLTIDLDAIAANYRTLLQRLSPSCALGTVVKADAYGLGMARVAPALAAAGCKHFFVADLGEATALRRILANVEIFVFNGPVAPSVKEAAAAFDEYRLIPILNEPQQVEAWGDLARHQARREGRETALQVDTGMNRLGHSLSDFERLAAEAHRLESIRLCLLISHLACADLPEHPLNARQLADFKAALALTRRAPGSLANSSGIFLGPEYHFAMARAGAALYGINPVPGAPNPMRRVVRLESRILQLREIDSPMTVGYGATYRATGPRRIATIAVGYADGYLRSLSNEGSAFFANIRVPVVGRVSMDYITLDVSGIPAGHIRPGDRVELIGEHHGIDDLAEEAGTIAYEILTTLGSRYGRVYVGGSA